MTPKTEIKVRKSIPLDSQYLKLWMKDDVNMDAFPVQESWEVDDAVNKWMSYVRAGSSLTATINGEPVGIVTLFLQFYKSLLHTSEMGIIASPSCRGQGVGTALMKAVIDLGQKEFKLNEINLVVFSSNRAKHLYERCGFQEFGRHPKWLKKPTGEFIDRIFMRLELGK